MQTILIVFHLFLAIGLIGLILIQHGKGADMGAAFGSGASGTVFGAKGSASFLTRLTAGLATLFFITSMVMAYFASQREDGNAVLDALQQTQGQEASLQPEPQTDLPPMPESKAAPSDLPVPQPEVSEEGSADLPPIPESTAAPSDLPVAQPEAAEEGSTDLPAAEAAPESTDQPMESDPAPAAETDAETAAEPAASKE